MSRRRVRRNREAACPGSSGQGEGAARAPRRRSKVHEGAGRASRTPSRRDGTSPSPTVVRLGVVLDLRWIRRGGPCGRPWRHGARVQAGTGQARPLRRPCRHHARIRARPSIGSCRNLTRDGTSPSPTAPDSLEVGDAVAGRNVHELDKRGVAPLRQCAKAHSGFLQAAQKVPKPLSQHAKATPERRDRRAAVIISPLLVPT